VDQHPRKVGIVLPVTHIDTRLHIDESDWSHDPLGERVDDRVYGSVFYPQIITEELTNKDW
jgi:hypothetical protein